MSHANVLVLGGASEIGLAIARRFAAAGYDIVLAARHPQELTNDCYDIALRYSVKATTRRFDVLETGTFDSFLDSLEEVPSVTVCCVGALGNQQQDQGDLAASAQVFRTNFEGPALILGMLANRLEAAGAGVIVGISSVAGDRGRASNYIYGAAKAGFSAFLSGLRNRMSFHGIQVLTVKPGFVRTRMIAGLETPRLLTASPDEVARAVVNAVGRRRNVIYVRSIWRFIMMVIGMIPEPVFKNMKI